MTKFVLWQCLSLLIILISNEKIFKSLRVEVVSIISSWLIKLSKLTFLISNFGFSLCTTVIPYFGSKTSVKLSLSVARAGFELFLYQLKHISWQMIQQMFQQKVTIRKKSIYVNILALQHNNTFGTLELSPLNTNRHMHNCLRYPHFTFHL